MLAVGLRRDIRPAVGDGFHLDFQFLDESALFDPGQVSVGVVGVFRRIQSDRGDPGFDNDHEVAHLRFQQDGDVAGNIRNFVRFM